MTSVAFSYYHIAVVNFNDDLIAGMIERKKKFNAFCVGLFTAVLICALAVAAFSYRAGENWPLYIAALCVCAVGIAALIALLIYRGKRVNRPLDIAICERVVQSFYLKEDMLKGSGSAEFNVTYDTGVITVVRTGFVESISFTPSQYAKTGKIAPEGGKLQFDISAFEKIPSLYATAGAKLWEFLQAYYFTHGEGFTGVAVTDSMGKAPLRLEILREGAPCGRIGGNPYIKYGLIK